MNNLVAGVMPNDSNIEFIGIAETKQVLWMRNGTTNYFSDLPADVYQLLFDKYYSDLPAVEILTQKADDIKRQVELYTFYLYGDLDTTPDYANGKLSESENFILADNCISLDFTFKTVTINSKVLTRKELKIISCIKKEFTDKLIASKLGIALSTFDYHKRNLFKKAAVLTKAGLMNKVNEERILL